MYSGCSFLPCDLSSRTYLHTTSLPSPRLPSGLPACSACFCVDCACKQLFALESTSVRLASPTLQRLTAQGSYRRRASGTIAYHACSLPFLRSALARNIIDVDALILRVLAISDLHSLTTLALLYLGSPAVIHNNARFHHGPNRHGPRAPQWTRQWLWQQ